MFIWILCRMWLIPPFISGNRCFDTFELIRLIQQKKNYKKFRKKKISIK